MYISTKLQIMISGFIDRDNYPVWVANNPNIYESGHHWYVWINIEAYC